MGSNIKQKKKKKKKKKRIYQENHESKIHDLEMSCKSSSHSGCIGPHQVQNLVKVFRTTIEGKQEPVLAGKHES